MKSLTEQLFQGEYVNHIVTEKQLSRMIGGSAARRYGLVNRALRAGELVRIQRGLYVLADQYRSESVHPFRLAQALAPGSYVSLETALGFHGWIPEAVYTTVSIVVGRKSKEIDHPLLGTFAFHPLAVHKSAFLELVDRVQINQQIMLVAKPLRALLDIVCFQKIKWQGLEWIENGLRIEREYLLSVTDDEFSALKSVYKHRFVQQFITNLQAAMAIESGNFVRRAGR